MLFLWWLSFTSMTFMRSVKKGFIHCSCRNPNYMKLLENVPGQGPCGPSFVSYLPVHGAVRAASVSDEVLCVLIPLQFFPLQYLLTQTLLLQLLVFLDNLGSYKLRGHLSTRKFMSPPQKGVSGYLKGCWGLQIRTQNCEPVFWAWIAFLGFFFLFFWSSS